MRLFRVKGGTAVFFCLLVAYLGWLAFQWNSDRRGGGQSSGTQMITCTGRQKLVVNDDSIEVLADSGSRKDVTVSLGKPFKVTVRGWKLVDTTIGTQKNRCQPPKLMILASLGTGRSRFVKVGEADANRDGSVTIDGLITSESRVRYSDFDFWRSSPRRKSASVSLDDSPLAIVISVAAVVRKDRYGLNFADGSPASTMRIAYSKTKVFLAQ